MRAIMDERISGSRSEGPAPSNIPPRQITSDVLLDQLLSFVKNNTKLTLLEGILKTAKHIHQQQFLAKAKRPSSQRKSKGRKAERQKSTSLLNQLNEIFDTGEQTKWQLKDFFGRVKQGEPISQSMLNLLSVFLESGKLSQTMRQNLQKFLMPFMSTRTNNDTIGSIIVKLLVSSLTTIAARGISPDQAKTDALKLLKEQADQKPAGLLTQPAAQLLANLNGGNNEQAWSELLSPAALAHYQDQLATGLAQVQGKPEILQSVDKALDQLSLDSDPKAKWRSFHSSQTSLSSVQIEMQYLQYLLAMLKQVLGSKNPEVVMYMAELAQAQKDYPNLTAQDMQNLQNIMNWGNQIEAGQSQSFQYQYLSTERAMIEAMLKNNQGNVSSLKAQLSQLTSQISNLQAVMYDVQMIDQLLQQLQDRKGSVSSLQKLLGYIEDLNGRYGQLSPQEKQQLNGFMNELSQINFTSGQYSPSLASIMGDLQIEAWTSEYLQSTKDPTKSGLLAFLKQQIANFPGGSANPFFQKMIQEMNGDVADFPNSAQPGNIFGPYCTYPSLGAVPSFGASIANWTNFANVNVSVVNQVLQSGQAFTSSITQQITDDQNQIAGIQQTLSEINTQNSQLSAALAKINQEIIYTQSLPDSFVNAIFNHFMPGQEAYLEELAMILAFDNLGASMNNAILSNIADFSDAGLHYNIWDWMQGQMNQNGQYVGTGTQIKGKISQEKSQISTDIGNANNAVGAISQQQSQISQELAQGKITASQAQQLQAELQTDKANLLQAIQNLQQLYHDLNLMEDHITINPNGTYSIPSTYTNNVKNDEQLVQYGDPNSQPAGFGGLGYISQTIGANAANYNTQSQRAQLNAQMAMTEIQQEWSVVTSAMQLLNQSYMTVAQGIYH